MFIKYHLKFAHNLSNNSGVFMTQPLVMVVDHDQRLLKLVRVVLELAGYGVVLASDGKSALELAKQKNPDLIIMAIKMPGELNGLDLLYYIRQQSSVPIIMLSALSNPNTIRIALEGGADDYITKPFSQKIFAARVKATFRRLQDQNLLTR
jgi:DNA-binding response OmpR family regulator